IGKLGQGRLGQSSALGLSYLIVENNIQAEILVPFVASLANPFSDAMRLNISNNVEYQLIDLKTNTTDTALVPISKPLTDYNGLKQLEFQRISEVITASTISTIEIPLGIGIANKNVEMMNEIQRSNTGAMKKHYELCGPLLIGIGNALGLSYQFVVNYTDTALVPISKPLTDYNGLKQLEFQRISEVITASTVFMRPFDLEIMSEIRRSEPMDVMIEKKVIKIIKMYQYAGRNFGVICCEPCKAFFRRNAFKAKPFICVFNDNCIISADNRNDCKKCRLDKCFALGMKCNQSQCDTNDVQIIGCKVTKRQTNNGSHNSHENNIQSDDNYDSNDNEIVQQIATNIVIGNKEGYNSELIPISKPLTDYNGLRQLELSRISEVIGATKVFIEPIAENNLEIKSEIELKVFADLMPEDQISLFKFGICQIVHMRQLTLEQQLYIYLLQRYLLLKYRSESESQTKLQIFMNSLKDLDTIHELQRYGSPSSDYDYTSPIVREIFDLV
ncbi:unnamed protein product, partial [Medioppia subpectinata]